MLWKMKEFHVTVAMKHLASNSFNHFFVWQRVETTMTVYILCTWCDMLYRKARNWVETWVETLPNLANQSQIAKFKQSHQTKWVLLKNLLLKDKHFYKLFNNYCGTCTGGEDMLILQLLCIKSKINQAASLSRVFLCFTHVITHEFQFFIPPGFNFNIYVIII